MNKTKSLICKIRGFWGCILIITIIISCFSLGINEVMLKRSLVIDLRSYITWILIFTILMRIVMTTFKTAAVRQGEADYYDELRKRHILLSKDYGDNGGRYRLWFDLFFSCGDNAKLDDYFLPTILGTIELILFPIFMFLDGWTVIGWWVGIKTVAQWKGWQQSRTPYMRFLVGSVLTISLALFLTKFIHISIRGYRIN